MNRKRLDRNYSHEELKFNPEGAGRGLQRPRANLPTSNVNSHLECAGGLLSGYNWASSFVGFQLSSSSWPIANTRVSTLPPPEPALSLWPSMFRVGLSAFPRRFTICASQYLSAFQGHGVVGPPLRILIHLGDPNDRPPSEQNGVGFYCLCHDV